MTPSIAALHDALVTRQVSPGELLDRHLAIIAERDPAIRAFVRLTPDLAAHQARAAQERYQSGNSLGPLDGIPMAVKDVLNVEGVEVTAGSRILEGYRAVYDATVVARLRQAGAVILGMTNCDEFAMGSSTENSAFHTTHNPWDATRVPGGSSGGSAAAVAAAEAGYSIGSDTGGSIRQPAALCGVVGLKPTYGRVSRYGLIAFASSLDQVGAFTSSVVDQALVLTAIAGHDQLDATSSSRPLGIDLDLEAGVKGLRLGLPREYFEVDGMEVGVKAAVDAALRVLEAAGAELVDVRLPHTEYGLAAYYIIAPAECSSNLARFDSVRFGRRSPGAATLLEAYSQTRGGGFGREVQRRVMLGTHALSSGYFDAYYLRAQKVRTLVAQDFTAAFEKCDAIVSATSPTVAFEIGSKTADPYQMYLCDVLTLGANLAGLPGLSVPCGRSEGLPVGLQILAPQWGEATALRVGRGFELAHGE
ncbi:MAG TPA: Asp-tRNA(Asn)/Glu-tRNA(Gln) amidotransferase subunit GatA [Candidatus Acidoferrales bacterium]|nr:Asp-tRNA(Asn)/Glu-tRNA(Gln) amidotransferase subunit GatA [Candidatus Acidoferrales bacterium]